MQSMNSSPSEVKEYQSNEYTPWAFYPTQNTNIAQMISNSLQAPTPTQQYDQGSQICSARSVYAPSQRRYTDGDLSSVCGKELQDYPDADASEDQGSFYNLGQMDEEDLPH